MLSFHCIHALQKKKNSILALRALFNSSVEQSLQLFNCSLQLVGPQRETKLLFLALQFIKPSFKILEASPLSFSLLKRTYLLKRGKQFLSLFVLFFSLSMISAILDVTEMHFTEVFVFCFFF